MSRPLPESLAPLFHRCRPESIDLDRHAGLVIRTVLSDGTWEQVLCLFRAYGWDRVREVVLTDHRTLRTLPEPTRRLWLLVFGEEPPEPSPRDPDEASDPLERWHCRRVPGFPGSPWDVNPGSHPPGRRLRASCRRRMPPGP